MEKSLKEKFLTSIKGFKKIGAYVIGALVVAFAQGMGLSPEAMEGIKELTMMFLGSQGAVDAAALISSLKK